MMTQPGARTYLLVRGTEFKRFISHNIRYYEQSGKEKSKEKGRHRRGLKKRYLEKEVHKYQGQEDLINRSGTKPQ